MKTRPISVIETPVFLNQTKDIWTEEERMELLSYIALNPEDGDIIPGTGGIRKLRWGRQGIGKRGGARVIYFYYHIEAPIYMLLAYTKTASNDLTSEQKRQIEKLTGSLKKKHDPKGN